MTIKDEIKATADTKVKWAIGARPVFCGTAGAGQLGTLPVHTSEHVEFSLPG